MDIYEYLDKVLDKSKDEQIKQALYDRVVKFMMDNQITCEEAVYQCDGVIENAYEFISDLFNIVKLELSKENKDEF